nr:aldo/keto reductase [Paenibacillus sp. AR247]
MDYMKLGNTGMDVSRICLGCMSFGEVQPGGHQWVLDEEQSRLIIKRALELGINFFDTANVYSGGTSEEITGRALKDYANRDEIVLATKVWGRMHPGPNGGGLSRKAIMSEIDKSLKRLGTDYVDLYIIHRWDYNTPIEETMEALHDVVKARKGQIYRCFRHVRVAVSKGAAYGRETTHRSETDQVQKSKYDATADVDRLVVERVASIAEKRGVPRIHIALAWLLQKESVAAPIIGATKIGQVEDAVGALSVKLSPEEIAFMEEPYVPHPVVGAQ